MFSSLAMNRPTLYLSPALAANDNSRGAYTITSILFLLWCWARVEMKFAAYRESSRDSFMAKTGSISNRLSPSNVRSHQSLSRNVSSHLPPYHITNEWPAGSRELRICSEIFESNPNSTTIITWSFMLFLSVISAGVDLVVMISLGVVQGEIEFQNVHGRLSEDADERTYRVLFDQAINSVERDMTRIGNTLGLDLRVFGA